MLCGSKWRLSNNSVVEVSWEGGGEATVRPTWAVMSQYAGLAPNPTSVLSHPLSCPQIASLRFVFLINQDLIALIRAEAAKITPQ